MILDLDLISKDVNLSKFWNESCQGLQLKLFLPHQIASQGLDCRSSSKLSNFTEEKWSFWKTMVNQKVLTQQRLLVSLLPSTTPNQVKETAVITRKIRIYPINKQFAFDLLSLHRRSYNLAIEHFKNTPYEKQLSVTELRRAIKLQVKDEWEKRAYRAEISGEAVRSAFKTRKSIIAKRKKGLKCDYKFKSIKEAKQYFIEQRLTKRFLGNFFVTEEVPGYAFGKTTNICFEHGRWFVCALDEIETRQGAEKQGLAIVAIDPGVRTFATTFDGKEACNYGDSFYAEKVFPLLLKLDKLFSRRSIFLNTTPDKSSQSFKDTFRFFEKRINKLRNKIDDLVSDLHRRVSFDLVNNNDIILLPTFETKEMSKKLGRKIRAKTVRSMLGLRHYQFKLMLRWMCKKYGKVFIDVNEAWTSKTISWSGKIIENLCGSKTISDGEIIVKRDINGARNILLRALSVASTDIRCVSCG